MLTVLVPLDGSPRAECAIPFALSVARRIGAGVELISVHDTPAPALGLSGELPHDGPRDQRRALRQQYLDATRRRLEAIDVVPVTTSLIDGAPAETLVAYVRETAPDLVVMTTHGRGGVRRLWLGSVTESLVRHVAVPVLAIPPTAGIPVGSEPRAIRRALVAVDGSPESEAVIAPLAALLGTAGLAYTLLRVVPPLHPLVRTVATAVEYGRDLGTEQRLANEYLQALAERLRPRGLDVSVATRSEEPPAAAIIASAAAVRADVIALATHARGPIGRLVHGSVADAVLRTAPVAVLLYHMPQHVGREDAYAMRHAPEVVCVCPV